jgi:integrase
MPESLRIPNLRHHKPSGQAVVTLPLPNGKRKDLYLGRWNSRESKAEYARIVGELAVTPVIDAVVNKSTGITVNEILIGFWRYAETYYGKESSERETYRLVIRTVRESYGSTIASDFGPLALKAVRQRFIDSKLTRGEVNRRTQKVVRIFHWAASDQLVPADVFTALKTVEGLRAGRSPAPDRPRKPIPKLSDIEAVFRHLHPTVIRMVKVQLLTGCRPGELCQLRPTDIDQSGPVWQFTPATHKNAYRGQSRSIMIGPKAQAELLPLTPRDPQSHYFRPKSHLEARRAARKTPLYPSHIRHMEKKRKTNPLRAPGDSYTTASYGDVVRRAIVKENARREALAGPGQFDRLDWHVHQLRHLAASMIRAEFGIENARAVLGHSAASMTDHYSRSANDQLAEAVARRLG